VAGEAHEQDVAGLGLSHRPRHEVLLAERAQLLAVGDAAIGASVEVEQPEFPADAEDQPAAVHGHALACQGQLRLDRAPGRPPALRPYRWWSAAAPSR
jgi:hypothetical protein